MTTILSLATTCRAFNEIINEQRHGIKDVYKITIDFNEFRIDRTVLASVKRNSEDRPGVVERYWHCSRVAVDNDLDDAMFKLRCSPVGVSWAANVLAAMLVNSHTSTVEIVGDHGVLFDHAISFLNLVSRRAPYHIDKLSFGLSTKHVSHIHYCKFWTNLLQPKSVFIYSLAGGVKLQLSDYYWLFTLPVDRVTLVNCMNLGPFVLYEVIKEWYTGKRGYLPCIDIMFSKDESSRAPFGVEGLLRKIKYKMVDDSVVIERRIDSDMKQIYKIHSEERLIVEDYWSVQKMQ